MLGIHYMRIKFQTHLSYLTWLGMVDSSQNDTCSISAQPEIQHQSEHGSQHGEKHFLDVNTALALEIYH